jgi:hypothetical protein
MDKKLYPTGNYSFDHNGFIYDGNNIPIDNFNEMKSTVGWIFHIKRDFKVKDFCIIKELNLLADNLAKEWITKS